MIQSMVTVVIDTNKDGSCEVFIPDLDIVQHGTDRVEATGRAIEVLTAIKRYCLDNGLDFAPEVRAADAAKHIKTKDGFVTVLCIE